MLFDSREFSRLGSWEFSRETERREVEVLADLLCSLSRSFTVILPSFDVP